MPMLNKAALLQHALAGPAMVQLSAQRPVLSAAPAVHSKATAKRNAGPIQHRIAIDGTDRSVALRAVRADSKTAEVSPFDISVAAALRTPPPTLLRSVGCLAW